MLRLEGDAHRFAGQIPQEVPEAGPELCFRPLEFGHGQHRLRIQAEAHAGRGEQDDLIRIVKFNRRAVYLQKAVYRLGLVQPSDGDAADHQLRGQACTLTTIGHQFIE